MNNNNNNKMWMKYVCMEPTITAKIIRIYAHKSVTALCSTACARHNAQLSCIAQIS